MLYVALLKPIAGTPAERIGRRLQWDYPEGIQLIAEYWLQTNSPDVVSIFEAESVAPIMAITSFWGDVFDITVVPALTHEEGMALAQLMMEE